MGWGSVYSVRAYSKMSALISAGRRLYSGDDNWRSGLPQVFNCRLMGTIGPWTPGGPGGRGREGPPPPVGGGMLTAAARYGDGCS